jgi:hypothetical protein
MYRRPISIFLIAHNIFTTSYCYTQIFLSLEGEFTTRNVASMYDAQYVSTGSAVQMFISVHCMVVANVINANYICN